MADNPGSAGVRGYLVLTVEEASGKTNHDLFTWDINSASGVPFEAFVKVELRGGARNVKDQTSKKQLVGETITWREELRLELLEGSNELRLMLCREKFQGAKRGTSVIAACGIFVNDILEACPIDKYFELFKPNAGGDGGYIRINMNFVKDLADLRKGSTSTKAMARLPSASIPSSAADGARRGASSAVQQGQQDQVDSTELAEEPQEHKKGGRAKKILLPLILVALSVAGGSVAVLQQRRNDKQKHK